MELRSLNKKGDATDPMIILVILAFLAISFIVGIFVNTKIQTIIQTTALNDTDAAPAITSALDIVNAKTIQRGYAMIFAVLVMFTLFSAFLVRQHPAFIFINIILLVVTMFTAVFVGNIYGALQDNPTLGPVIADQGIITAIMTNIVKIIMVIGGLNMIILFSKLFGAPQGGDFGL